MRSLRGLKKKNHSSGINFAVYVPSIKSSVLLSMISVSLFFTIKLNFSLNNISNHFHFVALKQENSLLSRELASNL